MSGMNSVYDTSKSKSKKGTKRVVSLLQGEQSSALDNPQISGSSAVILDTSPIKEELGEQEVT